MQPINHYSALFGTWTWTCFNPDGKKKKKKLQLGLKKWKDRWRKMRTWVVARIYPPGLGSSVQSPGRGTGLGGHRPSRFKAHCFRGARRTSRGRHSRDSPAKTPSSGLHLREARGHPAPWHSSNLVTHNKQKKNFSLGENNKHFNTFNKIISATTFLTH